MNTLTTGSKRVTGQTTEGLTTNQMHWQTLRQIDRGVDNESNALVNPSTNGTLTGARGRFLAADLVLRLGNGH
jgi:hypothetical protein